VYSPGVPGRKKKARTRQGRARMIRGWPG
jgi:hypothetical protein